MKWLLTLPELKQLVNIFVNLDFQKNFCYLLSGPLGSGKTQFVKFMALELGIKKTVTSPTFNIANIYLFKKNGNSQELVHVDCYRLHSTSENDILEIQALIKQKMCCIE
jgi:tRNA threonylcarbamoyladenosine biosynthesis protein TsaE